MNCYQSLIRTNQQKSNPFSARNLISFVFASLFICSISLTAFAQSTQQENFYLDHSILVGRHLTDNSQSSSAGNFPLSGFETYTLEDADPYYFAFESDHCHIDPFTSSEDGSENKQLLASCLRNQLWENDSIPLWIRATGATVLIGAAGSAGKVDDDLKFTMGFDKMDSILRDWLSNKEQ